MDELLGNRPEGESPAQSGASPREGSGSGALAERWYWLGLIPVAWGLYRSWAAVFSFWQVMKLFRHVETLQNMGLPIDIWTKPDGMMGRYVTSGGQLDLGPAVWMLLGWLAVSLAAAVLGLLIIFLGRRHVRKKRG